MEKKKKKRKIYVLLKNSYETKPVKEIEEKNKIVGWAKRGQRGDAKLTLSGINIRATGYHTSFLELFTWKSKTCGRECESACQRKKGMEKKKKYKKERRKEKEINK